MKSFLSSRDPETPPHLEPEVDALVRRNGPLEVGRAGPTCLCPDLPSSCSAQEVASSSPGRAWGGAPQALPCASLLHANAGGRVVERGAGGRTNCICPCSGPLQLQTSASPRSCTLTSSAWASVCLCAEVSCSSSECREALLGQESWSPVSLFWRDLWGQAAREPT